MNCRYNSQYINIICVLFRAKSVLHIKFNKYYSHSTEIKSVIISVSEEHQADS
jgi:hypothetical protein